MLVSQPFAIRPRDYMRSLAIAWLVHYWWIVSLPLAATAIWCIYNKTALYVLVMLIFIVYPMAMTLVWFNFAFSPRSIRAIRVKTVTLSDTTLTVDYITSDEYKPLPPETFSWNDVMGVEDNGKSIVLILGRKLDQRITIPIAALDDDAVLHLRRSLAPKLHNPEL